MSSAHRTHADGLSHVHNLLALYYAAYPGLDKIPTLTMAMLVDGETNSPSLRAKAAQTRHLAEFGLRLARLHEDGDGERGPFRFRRAHWLTPQLGERMRLVTRLFAGMVDYHHGCLATPFVPDRCRAALYGLLASLSALHAMWRDSAPAGVDHAKLPWGMRPKCHMLQHLAADQLQSWGSPTNFWCYGDEAFVGTIKRVAASNKDPRTLEQRVADKSMLLAGLDAYAIEHGIAV